MRDFAALSQGRWSSFTFHVRLFHPLLYAGLSRRFRTVPFLLSYKTTRRIRDLSCGDARIYLEVEVRRVQCKGCGKVKREKLPWLANNPFYTKRFSYYVGRKCRAMSIQDVAKELKLD